MGADTRELRIWRGAICVSIFYFPISISRSEEGL